MYERMNEEYLKTKSKIAQIMREPNPNVSEACRKQTGDNIRYLCRTGSKVGDALLWEPETCCKYKLVCMQIYFNILFVIGATTDV